MHSILILIALAIAPGLFLLWFYYKKDVYEPEPKKLVIKTFIFGALIAFPVSIIESIFVSPSKIILNGDFLQLFIYAFLVIATTEEFGKFFVVKSVAYNSPEFNEIMDGIVYAVASALGFATLENIFYVMEGGVTTAIARAILAVPGHAFFGGLMGYYMGLAKFNKDKEYSLLGTGLLLSIIAHGTYDFLLFTNTIFAVLVIPLMIIIYWIVSKNIEKAEDQSPFKEPYLQELLIKDGKYCTNCGNQLRPNALYCNECGEKVQ